jgi:hypothetical protein
MAQAIRADRDAAEKRFHLPSSLGFWGGQMIGAMTKVQKQGAGNSCHSIEE